jgi:hypothetical protein
MVDLPSPPLTEGGSLLGRTLFLTTSLKIVVAGVAAFLVWELVLAYASSPAQAAQMTVNSADDTTDSDS